MSPFMSPILGFIGLCIDLIVHIIYLVTHMLGLDHYRPLIYVIVAVASDRFHVVCAIYCYSSCLAH